MNPALLSLGVAARYKLPPDKQNLVARIQSGFNAGLKAIYGFKDSPVALCNLAMSIEKRTFFVNQQKQCTVLLIDKVCDSRELPIARNGTYLFLFLCFTIIAI